MSTETEEKTDAPAKQAPGVDELVTKFIELRDKKSKLKREYETKVEAVDALLERLERHFMGVLDGMGAESLRVPGGTVYTSKRTSATAADWDSYLAWVRENAHWDGLEKRVNKTFVEAFRNEYDDLPPGVNWREERVVNVRRT